MIVSRDDDFGVTTDKEIYLNDWLKLEFKDRVGSKRKIDLTDSLVYALKKMGETVQPEDEAEEIKIIERCPRKNLIRNQEIERKRYGLTLCGEA